MRRRQFAISVAQGSLLFVVAAASSWAKEDIGATAHRSETAAPANVRRSVSDYVVPDVTLLRDDGAPVNLPAELNDGRTVVLDFVYTSCTTICPMSSQVFEEFQDKLGPDQARVHLVSISIDPEQDTPARLRKYAAQFHALKSWNHYSGSVAAVTAVQRAFNAYRGDKMSHVPLTLVRGAPGEAWVRFDGFASADELMAERNKWRVARSTSVAR